jgi:membrane protease YdiL (CAAX protease family)
VVTAAAEVALAAVLLMLVHRDGAASLGVSPQPLGLQVSAGAAIGGLLAALQVALLVSLPRWHAFSRAAVGDATLSVRDIALISVIVGIAEELLFRAAVQPLIGNLWTSLAFAAVHANYAPSRHDRSTWPFSVTALGMIFALSLVLGETFERAGLLAAMTAHIAYDFVVLMSYRRIFGW